MGRVYNAVCVGRVCNAVGTETVFSMKTFFSLSNYIVPLRALRSLGKENGKDLLTVP